MTATTRDGAAVQLRLEFAEAVEQAIDRLGGTPLRTEYQMIKALAGGTYTLQQLYGIAEGVGLADRPGARDRIANGEEKFRRRVRSALYSAHRQGRAPRAGATWVIEGTADRPSRALFVWLPNDPSQLELVLGEAWDVLASCDDPIDLVLADPPWALNRGDRSNTAYQRTYRRNPDYVVPGYVDVEPAEYVDFTHHWIDAAVAAIRPGGYLAVVTGPQQAARVQVASEDAGMTYVNSISVPRKFGLWTNRRFVHQHWTITLTCKGPLKSKRRVFNVLPEFATSNGGGYPVDVWPPVLEERRPGRLRYDNMLPTPIPDWVVRATTNEGDLVADPFCGGGATPVACLTTGRRFHGGDSNPNSLRFTMARILAEVVPAIAAQRSVTG
jgi:DNA modification methylase